MSFDRYAAEEMENGMKLEFKNDLGSFEMTGGGDGNIRITAINGIGVMQEQRQIFTSFDFDGAVESARRISQRNITIGADMQSSARRCAEIMKILSKPCTMTIISDAVSRQISASSAYAEISKQGADYKKIAISLVCDDPYFYDSTETVSGIFVRKKLITSDTALPAVFSTRSNEAEINFSGDRAVEPIIEILGNEKSDGEGSIVIEDVTHNKQFKLNYVPQKDERITIDVAKRTAVSDINGNIIKYISDDSFMSDLEIEADKTHIKAYGYGAAVTISAYIRYRNKYIEAYV